MLHAEQGTPGDKYAESDSARARQTVGTVWAGVQEAWARLCEADAAAGGQ